MASSTLMSLLVKLGLDSSEFDKGLGDAEGKASGFGSKVGSGLSNVGFGLVAGGAALAGSAIAATTGLLVSSIGPASDLNESMNAVNVVFGEGAKAILAYGETASATVGLSNSEFNSLATTTGAFLQNVGFNADTAGVETVKLTERAADLASVFNTDVSTAMAAIQSGLKGEMNPLEQFGVKLNAAMIEAKAMEMGLAGVTVNVADLQAKQAKATKAQEDYNKAVKKYGQTSGEAAIAFAKYADAQDAVAKAQAGEAGVLTDSMKAQASLALIYEQTSKVQGDFANTSDGVANGGRVLKAVFTDLKASIGTALLPALQMLFAKIGEIAGDPKFKAFLAEAAAAVGAFATGIVQFIPQAISWFTNLFNWLGENKPVVVGILAAMGVAVAAFVYTVVIPAAIAAITAMAPVIAVMALVGAAAYLLYKAWDTNFLGIKDTMTKNFAIFKEIFEKIKNWFAVAIPAAIDAVSTAFTWLKDNILDPVAGAFGAIGEAISGVIGWFGNLIEAIGRIRLPDWLTPGSPTPFEMGIRGISDAVRGLATVRLPQLQTQFDAQIAASNQTYGNTQPPADTQYQNPPIDEKRLARSIRDAVLQAMA